MLRVAKTVSRRKDSERSRRMEKGGWGRPGERGRWVWRARGRQILGLMANAEGRATQRVAYIVKKKDHAPPAMPKGLERRSSHWNQKRKQEQEAK